MHRHACTCFRTGGDRPPATNGQIGSRCAVRVPTRTTEMDSDEKMRDNGVAWQSDPYHDVITYRTSVVLCSDRPARCSG